MTSDNCDDGKMRVIVAGCRDFCDRQRVYDELDDYSLENEIEEIVHGGCRGVDTLAGDWAREHGVPVRIFPARWREHGRAAGPIRNRQMAEYAQVLIAFWDGESRGTKNMIWEAERNGVYVHIRDIGRRRTSRVSRPMADE